MNKLTLKEMIAIKRELISKEKDNETATIHNSIHTTNPTNTNASNTITSNIPNRPLESRTRSSNNDNSTNLLSLTNKVESLEQENRIFTAENYPLKTENRLQDALKPAFPALPAIQAILVSKIPASPDSATSPFPTTRSLKDIIATKKLLTAQSEGLIARKIEEKEKNPSNTNNPTITLLEKKETFSLSIVLNAEQLLAKELAFAGKSFCIVGAAGTGKTTAQREIAKALVSQNMLSTHTFKVQGTKDYVVAPSIAFVAYTRIASGNLKKAIHKDPDLEKLLEYNITTIHNLLEYAPETYWDYEDNKEKFRFCPRRTASNPLDITHLIIEEASMVGLDLWENLFAALRCGVQIIFIGDINQLPPVFGASILNYGLVQLPVVSLEKVYRQAGDSLVLENAHRILEGNMVAEGADYRIIEGGNIQHSQNSLAVALGKQFPAWMDKDVYDPEQDIILSPWNKHALGTTNMNNWIAQEIGRRRNAIVFEILAGMTKLYLAVGDKIFYNKQVGEVVKIAKNSAYRGKYPQKEGEGLTRFGTRISVKESNTDIEDDDEESMFAGYSDLSLDDILEEGAAKDKQMSASHIVDVLLETGEVHTLSAVGDFSPTAFTLGYCLTVHKAQGCEWRRVFIIMHRDHKISLSRELFYTASTRAREQVYIISKKAVIESTIKSQRIKGNTIAEKIEYFNSGLLEAGRAVLITK